jgi:hypothetical protein
MAMKLSTADQERLNQTIDDILAAVVMTEVSSLQAREAIVHILMATATDDVNAVKAWLDPELVRSWKNDCRRA